jgi:hypothetical protein
LAKALAQGDEGSVGFSQPVGRFCGRRCFTAVAPKYF